MDSFPSVGPTISSETITAGAGNLPAFNKLANYSASSKEKAPVMDERPLGITSLTTG
jgi:hypothetical protein